MTLIGMLLAPFMAYAQAATNTQPVLMQADKLGYDQEAQLVVALGNVEVVQDESVLRADRITYYQQQNVVRATGNVVMMDKTGQIYFSDQAQVTGDLKQGIIHNLRTQTADDSRFAAREARRLSETELELNQATYSPCLICDDEDPLWQLTAEEIYIDNEEQLISYEDVWLEAFGIPLLYTPYLAHPTPDADRKSGFLPPEYSTNSILGTVVQIPYYFNIAPDKDATLTTYITTEEGILLEGEYRQLFENGEIFLNGSATFPEGTDNTTGARTGDREFRGHIFAEGNGKLTDKWNWGFDIERASDDTFLRRYGFGDRDTLQSRVFVDRLEDRSYILAQSVAFQGLEIDDDPDVSPIVLPSIAGEYESDPGLWGSRWRVEGNALGIRRSLGVDTNRVSGSVGWRLPLISDYGHLFEVDALLRTDFYDIENNIGFDEEDDTITRTLPRLGLSWKYPLVNHFESGSWVIEPTVVAVVSGRGQNPDELPNEDSLLSDFSDANIFSFNRFAGLDRFEEGTRVTVGVRSQWSGNEGEVIQASLGQSYSSDNDGLFPDTREEGNEWSDYVGQLGVQYLPLQANYRFRLDGETGIPLTHEVTSSFNYDPVSFGLNYLKLTSDPVLGDREEISASATFLLTDFWSLQTGGIRDIEAAQSRNAFVSFIYEDECLTFTTLALRDFTRDRDVEPNDQFLVNVILKNIN